jgi:hypothetical protein
MNIAPATRDALIDLGKKWAIDPARPRIGADTESAWMKLINDWVGENTLPLLVRKTNDNRGARIGGEGGRVLIPTDNSPAQWVFAMALSGQCPSLGQITELLERGKLPIAMILKTVERNGADYKGVLRNCPNTQAGGWKLAHIEGVKLGHRGIISACPSSKIKEHFIKFMSLKNMLVVPAEWAGLAEVQAFKDGYIAGLENMRVEVPGGGLASFEGRPPGPGAA